MKTILTIDFDIIMAPSIMIYNDLVPKNNIDNLKQKSALYDCCKIDAIHYVRLTRLLLNLMNKIPKEKIHFIHDHDTVTKYVDTPVRIFNIDHHHDFSYGIELDKDHLEKLGCANWVRWLYEKNMLNNYVWINNDNSNLPEKYLEHINILELK